MTPMIGRSDGVFVTARVMTRHPDRYVLVNVHDGSRWRMGDDGSWSRMVEDPSLAQRTGRMFPHEETCHSSGCPGLGFCHEAGAAYVQHVASERGRDAQTVPWGSFACGSRECDCLSGRVLAFVRSELDR